MLLADDMALEELVREPSGLVVRCLRNIGPIENNIFLVSDAASGEGYVIDGGYEPEQIAEAARDMSVKTILVTHGHRDHHENVGSLRGLLGTQVGIGIDDANLLSISADVLIVDQQSFGFGSLSLQAIHTPGHTPGSTCFLIGKHLFTGDTLFPGGPGNTQKDPLRFERIIASIRERLFSLPDHTVVYPGHGLDTTIGRERPHLDEWIARGW
jgi:glyoxylase-like metal-dependent hydrolase (beta-lactamase superfamily II)